MKRGNNIKTLIKNGLIVNYDNKFNGDILIDNGIIVKVDKKIEIDHIQKDDIRIIDAKGGYVFPGFVDAHTHLGLPEDLGYYKKSNDFFTESTAAISGGTTTIFDFAQQKKGERLIDALKKRQKRHEGNTKCNYHFHAAVTEVTPDLYEQLKEIKDAGVSSVKLYTTYDMKLGNDEILKVMDYCARLDMVVLVHCEEDSIIKYCAHRDRYPLTRPKEAEIAMINIIVCFAKITGCKTYICHTSCRESINIIEEAKGKGVEVYLETCPQYLLLNSLKYYNSDDREVTKYILSPPLREEEDNSSLIAACLKGVVDLISTDHCAFLYEEHKAKFCDNINKAAKGMPGIQLRGSLIFDILVEKNKLRVEDFVKLLSYNPCKIFDIKNRGYIKEGYIGDIVIWDNKMFNVSMDMIFEGTDYSPYEGMELKGRPVLTLLG